MKVIIRDIGIVFANNTHKSNYFTALRECAKKGKAKTHGWYPALYIASMICADLNIPIYELIDFDHKSLRMDALERFDFTAGMEQAFLLAYLRYTGNTEYKSYNTPSVEILAELDTRYTEYFIIAITLDINKKLRSIAFCK